MITLKSGEAIKAKILEVSPDEIKYKKFDDINGPTLVIPKSDVVIVQYENGTKNTLNSEKTFPSFAEKTNKGFRVEVGPSLMIPTGALAVDYSVGIGIQTTVLCSLSQNMSLFGLTGIDYFRGPPFLGEATEIGHNSILFGVRYTTGNFNFGLGGGLGSYFTHYYGQHGLEINPQIGYSINKINLQLNFDNTSTSGTNYSFLSLGVAWTFSN